MIPSIANIRKAIYCLNKRIDLLEGGEYSSTVTQLSNKVAALESLLDDDALNPTAAIDKFNEIVAFLNSIDNTETLLELLRDVVLLLYQQNYVTVLTYADLPTTGSAGTIYRVSNYNGSTNQIDTTSYSEYVWDNSDYTLLCVKSLIGEVFDISEYHGGLTYLNLEAALDSNNGGGVPQSLQKGGMSIKYVRSSDNKYVQVRCMADEFTTDVSQWQGVDNEPTAGSENLVKSGGVRNFIVNSVNSEKERAELAEQVLQDNIDNIKDETLEENRQMVNSIMENYAPVEITGDVNNAADEEDLTSVNIEGTDVLKFKDKVHNPLVYSGLGRKILRKNIVSGVNTLTQSMISDANTIYVIQYDFTLGEDINVPAGCVLEFDGGSLNNGTITINTNSKIVGNGCENTNLVIILANGVKDVVIDNIKLTSTTRQSVAIGKTLSQDNTYNLRISNCIISGYKSGINVNGVNLLITDNILYNNGNIPHADAYVDICAGSIQGGDISYDPQAIEPNIIVSRNRCLSNKVHRNIDCGELYGETNVIISENICVTMTDDGKEELVYTADSETSTAKIQCILVGYGGISPNNRKYVSIINNICKYCMWSGIYVRATNTREYKDISKYIANISGNTIVGVVKSSGNMTYHGAIGAELMTGSIISNNIIRDCTWGIDLGFIYEKGETIVSNNTVINAVKCIITDSTSEKLDIKNNNLEGGTCIDISGSLEEVDGYDSYCVCSNNVIKASSYGISCSGTQNKQSIQCIGNTIRLLNDNVKGINVYGKQVLVAENSISGTDEICGIGVKLTAFYRYDSFVFASNIIANCRIGFECVNGNDLQLIAEDNNYLNCTTKYNAACVFNGKFINGLCYGSISDIFYWLSSRKAFKVGDTFFVNGINASKETATVMVCTKDAEINNGTPVAKTSKWNISNLQTKSLTYANFSLWTSVLNAGQRCHCVDDNLDIVWNGTKWTEEDGAAAGVKRKGNTANRPVGSNIYIGFQYFDTSVDVNKPIYASAISGDTVTWVDATGATV